MASKYRETAEHAPISSESVSTARPDMELISVLYDAIEQNPPAISARALLIEHWREIGWADAAKDMAKEILKLDPLNIDARKYLHSLPQEEHTPPPPSPPAPTLPPRTHTPSRRRKLSTLKSLPLPNTTSERTLMEQELSQGYEVLRTRAKIVLRDTSLMKELQKEAGICAPQLDNTVRDLKGLVDGRLSSVVSPPQPLSARAVARAMEADLPGALGIAVEDLAEVVCWLRWSQPDGSDNDTIRETLARRIRVLAAALPVTPGELQEHPATALMHVEHEELGRTYVNDETMYGDAVADIPRANFWVSEDGYAWDMDELAAAITSNSGVMRNPLSREMFTEGDVQAIVRHPLGEKLALLREEQSRHSLGVRSLTVDKLGELSKALLADTSDDQLASRKAVDTFLAYRAILPRSEQEALDGLRVPARDSHTGQAFDCTIGEAVRDAQANKTCFHKTGDFIGQAAKHLRKSSASHSP